MMKLSGGIIILFLIFTVSVSDQTLDIFQSLGVKCDKDDEPIEKDDEPESGASATEFPQQIDSSERGLLRWLWINLCELNLIPSSLCRSRIPILNEGTIFNCSKEQLNPHTPTSVYNLTPHDISIVGAMGDSLTAAYGAEAWSIYDLRLTEYRGQSWSIGGDDTLSETTTLPNIIKQYNKNIKGFSTGKTSAEVFDPLHLGLHSSNEMSNSKVNVAVSGSKARNMPCQAELLVKRIRKETSNTDFREGWKVVTIFIGTNNLCQHCCKNIKGNTAQDYTNGIKVALDILYNKLPRTFVNLVLPMDVTVWKDLAHSTKPHCKSVIENFCPCETDNRTSGLANEYQQNITELIESGTYDKEDFTVVIQPMYTNITLPHNPDGSPDFTYFAPDCFHFSGKAHKEAAIALWNNMLQPVGSKSTSWYLPGKLLCPEDLESPFFKTRKKQ